MEKFTGQVNLTTELNLLPEEQNRACSNLKCFLISPRISSSTDDSSFRSPSTSQGVCGSSLLTDSLKFSLL